MRTRVNPSNKVIHLCEVVDIPAGATPKIISVRLNSVDGSIQPVIWYGSPSIQVGNFVRIQRRLDGAYDILGTSGNTPQSGTGDLSTIIVKNTSGATAAANDVGYINEDGEYKTTTTANANVAWCVVITGGANNADIYVALRGRVTVRYTGSAPSAGDYLVTSTTAGAAQQQTSVRPEIFAVCVAVGSGGTVSALLLTQRVTKSQTSDNNIVFINAANLSDFLATMNGAASGTSVVYNAPSSGNENAIVPQASTELAKILLHNTTRGQIAKISSVNTATNTITVTDSADVSAWQSGDTITTRSQTNTANPVANVYYYDMEITSTEIGQLAVGLLLGAAYRDTGTGGLLFWLHPYEANSAGKTLALQGQVANVVFRTATPPIPIISRRFTMAWQASGTGTSLVQYRIFGVIEAAP